MPDRLGSGDELGILDRMHERLETVYPRDADGKYDWYESEPEPLARYEALGLVRNPEYWRYYVGLSTKSEHAWRVLQLVVELLYDSGSMDLIINPIQGSSPEEDGLEWSPLFVWMVGGITGKLQHPKSRRGSDPTALVWRDISIWHTVNAIRGAGRPATSDRHEGSACHLIADQFEDLGYHSVRSIWLWGRRVRRRMKEQGKEAPPSFFP